MKEEWYHTNRYGVSMTSEYKIYWTNEAIKNLEEILEYLENRWTQKESNNFKKKLAKQIHIIEINPKLFPKSLYNPRLRKAVLSSQTTIFYEVKKQNIYLAYLFNNKKDIRRIK